eukprot:4439794-Prymnesium_polylepis.1
MTVGSDPGSTWVLEHAGAPTPPSRPCRTVRDGWIVGEYPAVLMTVGSDPGSSWLPEHAGAPTPPSRPCRADTRGAV